MSGIKKVVVNHNLQSKFKFINAKQAEITGELVEYDQFINNLSTKQNNLTGSSGIDLSGSTLKVDLAVSGTDYGTLTLTGTNYASLNGAIHTCYLQRFFVVLWYFT